VNNVLTNSEAAAPVQDTAPVSRWSISWTPGQFLAFLALTIFAAFPLVATGARTFFYRDFAAYIHPLNAYTRASIAQGSLPLWNPYSQCGVPHMAQLGSWYLPSLLGALVPPGPWFDSFMMLLHLAWAGFGMYWLARKMGASGFAGSFAGMAFVFNGVLLSSLQWTACVPVLAWMPWVVGSTMEAWKAGGARIATAAVCAAMQVLTGMPELTAVTWLFIAALWVSSAAGKSVGWGRSGLRLGAVVLLAAGLTMVQTLPFLDLVTHSQRDGGSATGERSMPGWGWANLLVPFFHYYRTPQGTWFQGGQDLLQSYYLGVGVLCVALAGILLARDRFTLVSGMMILFCWIMALGPNGFLYDWLRRACPLIGFARFPVKFAMFAAFLAPLLAVRGIAATETLQEAKGRRVLLIVAGTVIALICGLLLFAQRYPFANDQWSATLTNALWRALFAGAIVAGILLLRKARTRMATVVIQVVVLGSVAVDALTHNPNIAPTVPVSLFAPGMWQATGKPAAPKLGEGRIMISGAAEQVMLFSRIPDFRADLTAKRAAEWYNLNLLDGIPKVNGALALHPQSFDAIEKRLYYTPGVVVRAGMMDFLSVAWVSSPESAIEWVARTNYQPMLTAGQKPVFSTDDRALEAMTGESFRPGQEVYLPEAMRGAIQTSSAADCKVTPGVFTPQRVEATVEASAPALVVHAQTFYHLWRAFVDGHEVPLLRANVSFQALEVPAGKHQVKLVYQDNNLVLGAILSALSLAACAGIWVWGMKPARAGQVTCACG
jgi:hypothetical protein